MALTLKTAEDVNIFNKITGERVLDKGFVHLRNMSGPTRREGCMFDANDVDPAQSARMSFGGNSEARLAEEDHRLARFLIKNRHNTPLEMVEVWIEMKLPIFVARQFVRHRTACINEISARYVTLPADWYIPEVVGGAPDKAKQGQQDNLDHATQNHFKNELDANCAHSYKSYVDAIGAGVAPEHARMFLHMNHYTQWLWKQDLHNLMHFISLRDHPHAQIEAQQYAKAIAMLIEVHLPELCEAYRELHGR